MVNTKNPAPVAALALTSQAEILAALATNKINPEEASRLLGKLEKPRGQLSFKVSEKGAVSIYGMGRFPVTLYKEQMHRLLDAEGEIRAFIQANDARLKTKE